MGEARRSRRRPAPASSNGGSGEDRISGLPDELLHEILVRLRSTHAAARTSVLSRRWRHVWAHMPELLLVAPPEAEPDSFPGTVDAALGGCLAPTLEHLRISHCEDELVDPHIPVGRIAPWLHFAAQHVVGKLNLNLNLGVLEWNLQPENGVIWEEVVLELPVCERAKRIKLYLEYAYTTWLRPQATGVFKELTYLKIDGSVHMDGSDVTTLVSTQCPCLRKLNLFIGLIVVFDVFIHSNSLRTLVLQVFKTRRLEILAPRLEELTIKIQPTEAHISAPKLVKVNWDDEFDDYVPHLHRFVNVSRRLQLLQTSKRASSLTKRFDEVDELYLNISLKSEDVVATYGRFLNETNKLPKCESFSLSLWWEYHAPLPIVLHLLRSCKGTKWFRVGWFSGLSPLLGSCLSSCPCHLEESRKIDGIDLSSLEVVEIAKFSGSNEHMELLEFLSCNAGNLKWLLLIINDMFFPEEAREKVSSLCHPNVKVEYYAFRNGNLVRWYPN